MDIKKFNFKDLKNISSKKEEQQDITLADHIISQTLKKDDLDNNIIEENQPKDSDLIIYSDEDIEKIKLSSYEEGKKDGYSEALQNIDQNASAQQQEIKEILLNIRDKFENLPIIDTEELFHQNINHIKILSTNIAKKIASYALTQNLIIVIENMIDKYIKELKSHKKLILRLNPQFQNINQDLADILMTKKDTNFEIIYDENIEIYDVKIEWNNGFIQRNTTQILDEIERLIHRI